MPPWWSPPSLLSSLLRFLSFCLDHPTLLTTSPASLRFPHRGCSPSGDVVLQPTTSNRRLSGLHFSSTNAVPTSSPCKVFSPPLVSFSLPSLLSCLNGHHRKTKLVAVNHQDRRRRRRGPPPATPFSPFASLSRFSSDISPFPFLLRFPPFSLLPQSPSSSPCLSGKSPCLTAFFSLPLSVSPFSLSTKVSGLSLDLWCGTVERPGNGN